MPHTVALGHDSPTSALHQIRSLSRPFSILFNSLYFAMAALCLFMMAVTFFYEGPHIRMSNDFTLLMFKSEISQQVLSNSVSMGDIPLKARLVGIVTLGLLQWGTLIMVFFQFQKLFRLYADGVVFDAANISCLRRIGFWLVLWGLAPTLGHQIAEFSGVHDEGWLRFSSVAAVILGGLLQVIAKVIYLGREIEREQASFI